MIASHRPGRSKASVILLWRGLPATVVALTAFVCAMLGLAYTTAVGTPPTAIAFDFVSFDASASTASDPFAGSEFVLQRMQSYAQLASSTTVLGAVRDELSLHQSVAALQGQVQATTPPNTVLLQIQVTDVDALTAVRIADVVAKQAGTAIESLEARGTGAAHSPVHVVAIASGRAARTGTAVHSAKVTLLGLGFGLVLGLALGAMLTSIAARRLSAAPDDTTGNLDSDIRDWRAGIDDLEDSPHPDSDSDSARTLAFRRSTTGRRPSVTGVSRMQRDPKERLRRASASRSALPQRISRLGHRLADKPEDGSNGPDQSRDLWPVARDAKPGVKAAPRP